jgi:hypothetical protein
MRKSNKLLYTLKFYELSFSGYSSKEAYLKCCKWLANNIIGKDERFESVTFSITPDEKDTNTFKIELFCNLEEEEFKDHFCLKCKELHGLFYLSDSPGCGSCKMMAYRKQMLEKIQPKRDYLKGSL